MQYFVPMSLRVLCMQKSGARLGPGFKIALGILRRFRAASKLGGDSQGGQFLKTTGPHPSQVMSLCLLSGLGWIFRSGNPKTWSSRTEFIQGGVEEVIGTISASGGGVSHSFEGR